jgi:branched-chain amino acid transport system ATP-binding protein
MSSALEFRSVETGYDEFKVLFGISFDIPAGSVVALLGPNGAGKTTTLRVCSGIIPAWRGSVIINGEDETKSNTRSLARKGLCLIPEGRGVFPNLTVRENLMLHTHLRRSRRGARAAAQAIEEETYERFPRLGERRNQTAGSLSGGEQQMLALSRALTSKPSILLLDEISMGLAPMIVEELFGVIRRLADESITILLVEQMVEDALDIADSVILMRQGRIEATGAPSEVREQIESSYLGDTSTSLSEGKSEIAAGHAEPVPSPSTALNGH